MPAKKTSSARSKRAPKPKLRPSYKRIGLHPFTLFIVICMGVILWDWSFHSSAVSYSVTATIPAPPLTLPAVITSPTNGQTLTANPIEISGTCPLNSYIVLSINGSSVGEAGCTSSQTFSFQAGLFQGDNVLNAQDYNITNSPGPTSSSVMVTYSPASGSTSPSRAVSSTSQPTTSPPITPLLLTDSFTFQAFTTELNFTSNITIKGGVPPYTLYIQWGDGSASKQIIPSDPTFTINHKYQKPGYYPVEIKAVDSKGDTQYLQIAAFIHAPNASFFQAPASTSGSKPQNPIQRGENFLSESKNWLIVIWPSYAVIPLMVFSFWLGERQERRLLLPQLKHRRS